MNNSFDVITFGSAIVDIFLRSDQFKLVSTQDQGSVICQNYKDKVEIKKRHVCLGGGGTNVAVSLAAKGFDVAVAARCGGDVFGQMVVNQLKKESVNLDFLAQIDQTTDSSVILVGPDGGRSILVYRGPTCLGADNIDFNKLKSKWFYLSSLEGNLNLAEELLVYAEENGIKVFWNPGKRELTNLEILPLLSKVEVLMINRQEASILVDLDLKQNGFWTKIKQLEIPFVVVTDGKNGAYLQYSKGVHHLEAPEVEVVDETGAGDAFGSGFLAGLLNTPKDPKLAFKQGMDNAASVIQQIGAQTGLITN